ncbi:MAG: DUF4292 domain-containing protein [Bacteroidota bacterium]
MRPFAVLATALLVSGCVPTELVRDAPDDGTPVGYPNHTVEQIIAAVEASVAPVRSIAADGDLSFTSPNESQNASFSLRSRLSDTTVVTVRGPLGIQAGRALVTPDSVFLVNSLVREFAIGPITAADALVPGASLDARVSRAVLGLLIPEDDVAWSLVAEDGRYRLTGRLAAGTSRAYDVDPSIWRVVRVIEFDTGGRQSGTQEASAFDTVDGVVLPRRIRLERDGTIVEGEHRRLVVNPDDLRLRFRRPTDYETFEIR